MRKYKRYAMRRYAERKGIKASRYISVTWDTLQIRRVGWSARRMNQRHGTKPRWKWRAA